MNEPILYTFRRCPYAIRARMALAYSQINHEIREVSLSNKPAELLEISPKGTVPVLVLPSGIVLEESLDIMYWALKENDPNSWILDQKKADKLIWKNDFEFKPNLDGYKYPQKNPSLSAEACREKAETFLDELETLLVDNPFLLSSHLSLADIAIFPFIRQMSRVDEEWFYSSPHTQLQKWLKELLDSTYFSSVMKKHNPWASSNPRLLWSDLPS